MLDYGFIEAKLKPFGVTSLLSDYDLGLADYINFSEAQREWLRQAKETIPA